MLEDSAVERVLAVTAHPDDVDFGAAGTIAGWTAKGIEVHYCILTNGDQGGFDDTPRHEMGPLRQREQRAAADVLDVPPDWIVCGNGSDDLLTILTRTFVGSGQTLRLPYPSYILYRTLAELQGASSEEVPFDAEWRLPAAFSTFSAPCPPR